MSEDCPNCIFEKTEANCRGCFEGSHYKAKPVTNGDHIRAMTDEELARWISEITYCGACKDLHGFKLCDFAPSWNCEKSYLDWLKQEATE